VSHLEVIHENSDYIVVNKSAGLISEKNPFEDGTVEDQVFDHLVKTKRKPFIGVIHRLDRVTSGVLIFAKKKGVLVAFNELFASRKIQKTYLAVVKNKPAKNNDVLQHFLVKNKLEKRAEIVATKSNESQDCELSFKLIGKNDFGYLLEVKPKTGRFHQIRVQLAHIGLPIIGDEKYGSNQEYLSLSVCLHAWKIAFQDPITKEQKNIEAAMPKNELWSFESINSGRSKK
jgi:23S rRNA pseudouridine1911/1915/1917 synthase